MRHLRFTFKFVKFFLSCNKNSYLQDSAIDTASGISTDRESVESRLQLHSLRRLSPQTNPAAAKKLSGVSINPANIGSNPASIGTNPSAKPKLSGVSINLASSGVSINPASSGVSINPSAKPKLSSVSINPASIGRTNVIGDMSQGAIGRGNVIGDITIGRGNVVGDSSTSAAIKSDTSAAASINPAVSRPSALKSANRPPGTTRASSGVVINPLQTGR